jgi:hypothetical protein
MYLLPFIINNKLILYCDQKLASDSSGLSGGFSGQRAWVRILKNGRQAAIVMSWLLLVQLPGQVLSSYSSEGVESKFVLNVNNKINLFSGHSKIFHRANFNDSVLVRTNATMVRL